MPIEVRALGEVFTFPSGTSEEEISSAVDEYYASLGPTTSANSEFSPFSPEAGKRGAHTQQEVLPEEIEKLFRDTPELKGIMAGEPGAQVAKVAALIPITPDKNELANIIAGSSPNISIIYNKDAQDNVQPFLFNSKTGVLSQVNKPGLSKVDIGQLVGMAAAYNPASRAATTVGAGVKALGTEAVIQGAQAATGGEFNPEEVILSGGLGAGMKAGENALRGGARYVAGEADNALLEEAKRRGIPIMTTDVVPPNTFIGKSAQYLGERTPFIGTGKKRALQQDARVKSINELQDKYGVYSYEAIINSLKNQKNKVKQAAGSVLELTGNKLDDVGEISLKNTKAEIGEVTQLMSRPGVMKSPQAEAEIKNLVDTLNEAPQTFSMLKENRTFFKDVVDAYDAPGRSQLPSTIKSKLGRIYSAMKADMDEFAKANLDEKEYLKWQRANAVYAEEAGKLTKTRLKSVLDSGDYSPESVKTMLFSRKPSEVKLLYNSLTPLGKNHARSAIISDTMERLSRRSGGITPNTFISEMKKNGIQVDTFFKGAEKKELEGLIKVLDVTRRSQDASLVTATGQQAVPVIAGASIMENAMKTIASIGTGGTFARAYESEPVRNVLMRISYVKPGTKRMDDLLKELASTIESTAQAENKTSVYRDNFMGAPQGS